MRHDSSATTVRVIVGALPPITCGVGEYTRRLLSHLSRSENLVLTVTTLKGSDPLDVTKDPVENWTLREFVRLARRVHKKEVVLLQYPSLPYLRSPGVALLVVLMRLRRIRIVTMLHEFSASSRRGKILILATIIGSNRVVVSNHRDLTSLPRIIRSKTQLVPIGSNIACAMGECNSTRLSDDLVWVVGFGLLLPSKRFEILMEVARTRPSGVGFVFMGKVLEQDAYSTELSRQLSILAKELQHSVVFHPDGTDQEISEFLRQASIFVNADASPLTGKSGTALAACLHGAVPIGTAARDPRDNRPFEDNINAILLDDVNAESISRSIAELIADVSRLNSLQSGAARIAAVHSWEAIASHFEKILQEVG